MDDQGKQRVDFAVKRVMNATCKKLIDGLEPQDALWIQQAYEDTVLPLRMRPSAEESDDMLWARIKAVGNSIIGTVAQLPPEQRMRQARRAYYAALLAPLSISASGLAQAQAARREPDPSLQAEAVELEARLDAFVSAIEGQELWLQAELRPELSEALLDCRFAAGRRHMTSLRLNRWLAEQALNALLCSNCGAQPPQGSQFCNRCGQPMNRAQ